MKKTLLLMAMVLLGICAQGAETTITMKDIYGSSTITLSATNTWGNFTAVVGKGEGSNAPAYNKAGDVRLYAKNTLNIKSEAPITKIVFTISTQGKKQYAEIDVNTGAITEQGAANLEWTGEATDITFTVGSANDYGTNTGSKSGQFDFTAVTITTSDAAVSVLAPEFSISGGVVKAGTEVSITCDTEGASIYYTTDGTVPSNSSTLYNAPIAINNDMTIKAIAYKGQDKSYVSSETYTVAKVIESISAVKELTNGTAFTYDGTLTVVGQYMSGTNAYVYVYDGEDYTLIYGRDLDYKAGDALKAGWEGKVSYYAGLFEIAPVTNPEVDGTADVPEPAEITENNVAAVFVPANINNYYVLKSATLEAATTAADASTNATLGDQTIVIRNKFALPAVEKGTYDIVGFISAYDNGKSELTTDVTKLQFFPVRFIEGEAGIEAIMANDVNAPVEYYNLQGMKVANPQGGVFIKRQGDKAVKVML